jgi:hypothetical protein
MLFDNGPARITCIKHHHYCSASSCCCDVENSGSCGDWYGCRGCGQGSKDGDCCCLLVSGVSSWVKRYMEAWVGGKR